MKIDSRDKLEKWLDQYDWFENGFISAIEKLNDDLIIKIGFQTKGTYVAGEKQELIELELKPSNVSKWNYETSKFQPSYEYLIDGIDIIDNELGLRFETPYTFELICESIEIGEPKFINTYTKPWISERAIFITAKLSELPKPQYWIEELIKYEKEVCFRYIGSQAIEIDKIPYPDYSGYFLQHRELINENNYGLFFFSVNQSEGEVQISIENKYKKTDNIYKIIQEIISEWNLIKVSCGNVKFKGNEWKEFITNGNYPKHIEVLKKKNVWR